MNISKLLKKYNFTKSPYIFYDEESKKPSMYFTVYENDKWQLYFTNNKEVQKVDFLQDSSIEQVTCFKKQGFYCVSFCGKMSSTNSLFYAETINPTLFKIFTSVAHNIKTGVVTPNKIIIINNANHLLVYLNKLSENSNLDNVDPIRNLIFDFKSPTGIKFVNNDLNQLLISYMDLLFNDRHGTIYVNLNNIEDQKQLLNKKNLPLYDITIDPNTKEVLYSKKIGLRKFHRKITKTFIKNIISNQVSLLKE